MSIVIGSLPIDTERRWHVLRTRSRQEKALASDLVAMDIPHFLPLFAKMGAEVVLCGPNTLLPLDLLGGDGGQVPPELASVKMETDLDRAMEGADVVMALRLQAERQHSGFLPSLREYIRRWQVTEARLKRANPGALVMHPGPMNEGIEISSSIAHGGSSVIEEQVTGGVAVRMALLYQIANQSK